MIIYKDRKTRRVVFTNLCVSFYVDLMPFHLSQAGKFFKTGQ